MAVRPVPSSVLPAGSSTCSLLQARSRSANARWFDSSRYAAIIVSKARPSVSTPWRASTIWWNLALCAHLWMLGILEHGGQPVADGRTSSSCWSGSSDVWPTGTYQQASAAVASPMPTMSARIGASPVVWTLNARLSAARSRSTSASSASRSRMMPSPSWTAADSPVGGS